MRWLYALGWLSFHHHHLGRISLFSFSVLLSVCFSCGLLMCLSKCERELATGKGSWFFPRAAVGVQGSLPAAVPLWLSGQRESVAAEAFGAAVLWMHVAFPFCPFF